MFNVRAYRAIDEPDSCAIYLEGHIQVLKDYGITNITSNNKAWMDNPGSYCVIATDEDDEMVSGIRVQIKNEKYELPVEEAVGYMDPHVYDIINSYWENGGIGELCGLWNSKKVKKVGTSLVLVRAAIAITSQLQFDTLTGICSDYSMKMFTDVGFVVNKDLGDNGDFYYPNEDTIAKVVGILNAKKIDSAAPLDKKIILSLRDRPQQEREEEGPKGRFNVEYNLNIHSLVNSIA